MTKTQLLLTITLALTFVRFDHVASADEPVLSGEDFIAVRNATRLPARIACMRIGMGVPNDYKPCITRLKGGDLLVVAFAWRQKQGKREEYFISFRSSAGGRTWGPRTQIQGIRGCELFVTTLKDGTLLMSSHILPCVACGSPRSPAKPVGESRIPGVCVGLGT